MQDDIIVHYLTDGYWQQQGETRRKFDVQLGGTLTVNITALTPEGQQLARWALESWSNVTGINFQLVTNADAHITFDDDEPNAFSYHVSISNDGYIMSARNRKMRQFPSGNQENHRYMGQGGLTPGHGRSHGYTS